jgi:hypothetical protein
MAARRLLIVLLVLIAVSTAAAALVPTREPRTGTGTETVTTRSEPERADDAAPSGRAFDVVVVDDGKGGSIRLRVGDQVSLTVHSRRSDEVEIAGFGALEPAAPGAPARFDLIADRPGRFPVRLVDAKRQLATIFVVPAERAPSG